VFLSLNSENKLRRKHLKTIKRKIMKSKIRTLVAICILGFIGAINVNAANYRNVNNNSVVEEVKNVKTELGKADGITAESTEKTSFESDASFETAQFLLNEDLDANIDLQKEAQSVTKWIVDQEESRVFQKLINEASFVNVEPLQFLLNEDLDAKTDLQKEAQSVTKWIVDNEESKLTQKLIDEGKLGVIN
jgi:phosphoribosyl-ATP pyrophosphohydrolase